MGGDAPPAGETPAVQVNSMLKRNLIIVTSLAAFVVPGDPARSELYRRITPDLAEASAVELMPLQRKPLTLRERELVRAFIAAMPTESSR